MSEKGSRLVAVAVALLAGTLAACRDTPRDRLPVTFSGCAGVLRGPVCLLSGETTLVLWVEGAQDAPLAVFVDGRQAKAEVRAGASGRTVGVTVAGAAGRLEMVSGDDRYRLALRPRASCPGIEQARTLARRGRPDEALARLEQDDASPACHGQRLAGRARLLLSKGRTKAAIELFRRSLARRLSDSDLFGLVQDGTALAYVLTFQEARYESARRLLEGLAQPAASHGEGLVLLPYFQGQLARETGDLRAALRLFTRADTWARRLDQQTLRLAITQARADLLQVLGREVEASDLLEGLLGAGELELSPCARADLLINVGWLRLLRRESGAAADPLPVLEEALGLYRGDCRRPADEANVLVNLSLAAVQDGRLEEAQSRLLAAKAMQAEPDALIAPWLYDLAGRLAIAHGRYARALRAYDAMQEEAPPLSQARWRATLGRALSLEGLRSLDRALDAFEQAERLLDEQVLLIPVEAGRGSFLRDREQGARHLVDLLLEKGEVRRAMVAARRSRARFLWSMAGVDRLARLSGEARRAWERHIAAFRRLRERLEKVELRTREAAADELPRWEAERTRLEDALRLSLDLAYQAVNWRFPQNDELPAPPDGTLLLVYHPLPRGWAAFAVTHAEVTAARVDDLPPASDRAETARRLLGPFAAQIDAAERIRILAFGRLEGLDFHALPWEGDVLLARAPVAYSLDLSGSGPASTAPDSGKALLVADPGGNLRSARKAAGDIQAVLAERGYRVQVLRGQEATGRAVASALRSSRLFHFAGHAHAGGREGWESHLTLAGGDVLDIPQILAADSVPQRVVLAACESARTDAATHVQTLGMGQAFVVAGSAQVLAAARPLNDAVAARLSVAIYQREDMDLAEALRSAQLQMRKDCLDCDWSSYRVLVP